MLPHGSPVLPFPYPLGVRSNESPVVIALLSVVVVVSVSLLQENITENANVRTQGKALVRRDFIHEDFGY